MQRPGQIFTRSVLLDTVWGGTTGTYTNSVDLYVHYLRKKLDRAEETSRIRTVHGTGYTFDRSPSPSNRPRNPDARQDALAPDAGVRGIFALILLFLSTAAVVGFSRELTNQQDTLLTQEAKDQAKEPAGRREQGGLGRGLRRVQLGRAGSGGRVTDRDPTAATLGTLGLPAQELAEQALEEQAAVSATIQGPQGRAAS
jgi:hypothetical protein